jgi:peptidoglycan/xylan/chitin deacetylase (PgdA/CDA1 family)
LAKLKSYDVRATFFVTGNGPSSNLLNPVSVQHLKDIHAAHQVASHTYTHPYMSRVTMAQAWDEMSKNDEIIKNIIGERPRYMRFPYLGYNEDNLYAMESWGYVVADINIDTKDFLHSGLPNEIALNIASYNANITSAVGPGRIMLNHDRTTRILEWIDYVVKDARSRNYVFVDIATCLGKGEAYRI